MTDDNNTDKEEFAEPNEARNPGGEGVENTAPEDTLSGKTGAAVGTLPAAGLSLGGSIAGNFLLGATSKLPGRTKIWQGFIKAGHKGLRKATKADALCYNYTPDGRLRIDPVQWSEHATDDGKPLWITPGERDKWVPTGGRDTVLGPGNIPIILGSSNSYSLNNEIQARAAEAVDLGDSWPVFTDPKLDVELSVLDDINGEAVTDGGTAHPALTNLSIRDIGVLDDHIVDIGGTNNMQLSFAKYSELYPEKMASEEHKNAEFRGRMSEQDKDYGRIMLKLMLIAGAIVVLSLAAVFVLPELLAGDGGSSGGGGGILGGISMMAQTAVGMVLR